MELHRDKSGNLEARLPPNFGFQISDVSGSGRCLISNREIRHNETVLTDSAILLGAVLS